MIVVNANSLSSLSIGRHGENLARQVVFDVSDWEAEYGHGVVELIAQRPGDEKPYPVAVKRDGTQIIWEITSVETSVVTQEQTGKCELRYYVGETLVKSKTWRTWVEPAMDTPSETAPPEPEQGWVDQVLAVGAAVKAAADAAKADADRAAALAAEVAENAAQTAQDATESAQAKDAAQTAQRLAEEAQSAAEAARNAAETAQAAAEQSATNAATAKQGAEAALKAAQEAAAAAAKALADLQALYQEMQTWAQGVVQDVNEAGSHAVQSVQSAGDAQVLRVTDEGTRQTANAKAQADAAAQSAQQAEESAAVYDTVAADVTKLKDDLTGLQTVVDSKADKTDLAKTNLYLDALYKLNKGQTYDVLEQESEAYSVDVQSGAKYVGIDKVGGKSVVWNQLINGYRHSENVIYDDGRFIVSNFSGVGSTILNDYINLIKGHKYFIESSSELNNCLFYIFTLDYKTGFISGGGIGLDSFLVSKIVECSATNIYRMYLNRYGAAEDTPATNYNGYFNLFDLTAMFGAGNEPSTVEEFEAMFPAEYYPYSEPTIISSQTDRVDVASADGTISQQITTNFPALNSAGSVYDYIDLNEGKLYTWTYIDGNEIKALTEPVITDIEIPTELTDWLTVETGGSVTFHNADDGKRLLIPNKLSFIRKLDEVTV